MQKNKMTEVSNTAWPLTNKLICLSYAPEKVLQEKINYEETEHLYQDMLWVTKIMKRQDIEKNFLKWCEQPLTWWNCEETTSLSPFDVADLNDVYYDWSKNKWAYYIVEKKIDWMIFKNKVIRYIKAFIIGYFVGQFVMFLIKHFF